MESKNPSALMSGYQAMGDWLGLRQDRNALPAAESRVVSDEEMEA
jgi:hypothetical protein